MLAPLRTLPAFPVREAWSGETVRLALQAMEKGKAPGLYEWFVHELRELTPTLRECIADLLNAVETQGRWPSSLPGPLGILLPKGGTEDPMDRRPIWLMPMVYRMWASHRASTWAAWRLQWPGETPFEGADSLAWETSLHQEAALGRGTLSRW